MKKRKLISLRLAFIIALQCIMLSAKAQWSVGLQAGYTHNSLTTSSGYFYDRVYHAHYRLVCAGSRSHLCTERLWCPPFGILRCPARRCIKQLPVCSALCPFLIRRYTSAWLRQCRRIPGWLDIQLPERNQLWKFRFVRFRISYRLWRYSQHLPLWRESKVRLTQRQPLRSWCHGRCRYFISADS